MEVRINLHSINLSWPLWVVLIFLGLGNSLYIFLITLPEIPEFFLVFLSPGSTDAASRIMISFFTLSVLFAIHLETDSEPDIIEKFLLHNLPAILWGFGLACFFGMTSITLTMLFGLSGYLLIKDPKYGE